MATKKSVSEVLFIKHESGAMHALSARKVAKLSREVLADRGQPEIVALVEAGYEGFLGDAGEVEDFEQGLEAYFRKRI